MFGNIYTKIVQGNQKAIVGFAVAAVGTLLATQGISLDITVRELLTAVFNGAVTAAGVWIKANK